MDTSRQIVRWSIPGWCFFIFLQVFIGIDSGLGAVLSGGYARLNIGDIVAFFPSTFLNATTVVVLGFAGIPIGYLIYQVYFWLYWRGLPIPFVGLVIDQDKGALVLEGIKLTPSETAGGMVAEVEPIPEMVSWSFDRLQPKLAGFLGILLPSFSYIPFNQLRKKDGSSLSTYQLAQMLARNWATALHIWYRSAVIPSEYLDRQVSLIFDIFHSQGAVRTALMLAFPMYLGYAFISELGPIPRVGAVILALGIASNMVVFILVFKLFTALRRNNLTTGIEIMRRAIQLRNYRVGT